jgi:hypothetical protein
MNETRWEQQTDQTPQTEEPAPPREETVTPTANDSSSDWQGYSPEILCTVLDS